MRAQRVIVLGIDGCSRPVFDELAQTGDLPNLTSLLGEGATATLDGATPLNLVAAWASLATGTSAVTHGLFGPAAIGPDERIEDATQRHLHRPLYYELLGREGLASVVVNLPFGHVACENTVVVSFDPGVACPALPMGRQDYYGRLLQACAVPRRSRGDFEKLCGAQRARLDLTRELFLSERWNHFLVRFSLPGELAAARGGALLSQERGAIDAFLTLYRQLDTQIGWMLKRVPDAVVVVVAPTGTEVEEAVVDLLTFLRREGLVASEPARDNLLSALRQRVSAKTEGAARDGGELLSQRNRALYVSEGVDLEVLRERLLALRLDDGRQAFTAVRATEELTGRPARPDEPALICSPAPGVRLGTNESGLVVEPGDHGRGAPSPQGMLILGGEAARSSELRRVSLHDVAPTILWLSGIAIPDTMPGEILTGAFEPDFVAGRELGPVDALRETGQEGRAASRFRVPGYL
jgi:predicted AlkP superfamily phosphohydrolase/phosphomutase